MPFSPPRRPPAEGSARRAQVGAELPKAQHPQRYFTDDGFFRLPEPSKNKGGFFFCIDPSVTNVFDLPLPRPI
jgi:hypothetical protein